MCRLLRHEPGHAVWECVWAERGLWRWVAQTEHERACHRSSPPPYAPPPPLPRRATATTTTAPPAAPRSSAAAAAATATARAIAESRVGPAPGDDDPSATTATCGRAQRAAAAATAAAVAAPAAAPDRRRCCFLWVAPLRRTSGAPPRHDAKFHAAAEADPEICEWLSRRAMVRLAVPGELVEFSSVVPVPAEASVRRQLQ